MYSKVGSLRTALAAATVALAALWTTTLQAADTIKVGILHSLGGPWRFPRRR